MSTICSFIFMPVGRPLDTGKIRHFTSIMSFLLCLLFVSPCVNSAYLSKPIVRRDTSAALLAGSV